jgi:hypothetical protein
MMSSPKAKIESEDFVTENNQQLQKARALKQLKIVKQTEAEKLKAGWKWEGYSNPQNNKIEYKLQKPQDAEITAV